MDSTDGRRLSLALRADTELIPVAVPFVEHTSQVFGLGKDESLQLTLAAEEIFSYLAQSVCPGAEMVIYCTTGIYYTKVSFLFPVSTVRLGGLNIASSTNPLMESGLEQMGLIIAARLVDRLSIAKKNQGEMELTIIKDKAYPSAVIDSAPMPLSADGFTIEKADNETLKTFTMLTTKVCRDAIKPAFFHYPGKVADMVLSKAYQALVALNQRKQVCGGIIFHHRNEKIVEVFGPFVFVDQSGEEVGVALWEACLGGIARTKTVGVVSLHGIPDWLKNDFESLGFVESLRETGSSLKIPAFYRLLHEDPGGIVWTDAGFAHYLQKEYDRLVLARDIRIVANLGEESNEESIFSTEFLKRNSEVILRPLWPGKDAEENLRNHLQTLKTEKIDNIFFEVDLGVSSQALLIPALITCGFRPAIIVPFAGVSDLVIFQYHAT